MMISPPVRGLKRMRILLILILAVLLAGCDTSAENPREIELGDLVFAPDQFSPDCSLIKAGEDAGAPGNPVLSSNHAYAQSIVARWFDPETATAADGVLISRYEGKQETDEIGLFGIEFRSVSAAKAMEKQLKAAYPDKSRNEVYRHEEIVIWLWQDAEETESCFKKLEELVEKEIARVSVDIRKHF